MIPEEDEKIGLRTYYIKGDRVPHIIKYDKKSFNVVELIRWEKVLSRISSAKNIQLILVNKNWGYTTHDIINMLSASLRLSREKIVPLGIKDRYSRAYQYFIIYGYRDKLSIKTMENIFYLGDISPYTRREEVHRGNLFKINIKILSNNISRYVEKLNERLKNNEIYPNYYGYQRFGIRRNNHILGLYLLRRNYKEFIVELTTGEYLPSLERKVKKLINKRIEPLKIIKRLGKWYRNLLVNAFQSFIFNMVLSRRIDDGYPLNICIPSDYCLINGEVRYVNTYSEGRPLIPLMGYSYRMRDDKRYTDSVIKSLMKEYGIKPKDFYNNEIGIKIYGGFRPTNLVFHKKPCIYRYSEDEISLTAELERGGYATILLRELLKPSQPSQQGY